LNIFLPKIDFGFGEFYLFDFVNIALFIVLLSRGRLFTGSIVISSYVAFVAIGALTFFVGMLNFGFFDTTSFLRLIKFTLFILFLVIPYYLYKEYSFKDIMKALNYQVLFVILSGLYVVYHMIFEPRPINDYVWAYDNRYRLVGLTGYALNLQGGIERVGSTSVSMGVFIGFLVLVFFSLYKFYRKKIYVIIIIVLLLGEFVTYSRAGILVLVIGFGYHVILNLRPSLAIKMMAATGILALAIVASNATEQLLGFGTISKITNFSFTEDPSIATRVSMLSAGAQYIGRYPTTLLWGSGYGEGYTKEAIGYDHLEGLIPTTLFTSGFLAVLLILLHFYFVWDISKRSSRSDSDFAPFMYGLRLFVPGWFASAMLAGNTFQTDFYFPIIYFIFFVSYFKIRSASEARVV
jgi:hypothetical protein